MLQLTLITDGACSGNGSQESCGGWGAIIQGPGGYEVELSGGLAPATNNQAEMLAVIHAVEFLRKPCELTIISDSQYVIKGYSEWMPNWKKKNWINSQKKPVMNRDLWERMDLAFKNGNHQIREWIWVKGHNGHILNERVDKLARSEADKLLPIR